MPKTDKTHVTVVLEREDAWNLALLLKRLTFDDLLANAQDRAEAEAIRTAIEHAQKELSEAGIAPR